MSINIGKTVLKHGLILAPMAGFTDYAFRRICREHGAEYTVSEMVSAKALCYEQIGKKTEYKTSILAAVKSEELPMAIQLFGSDPHYVAEAAKMIESGEYKGCVSEASPTAIDINMGCPMHKIVGNGEGSALMKNPRLASDIVAQAVKALDHTPVTVKIRAGWDDVSKNAPEMAKMLEDAGASLICVHARTREQMYNPGIDATIIEKVKKAVKIPVIGNGDVCSYEDARKMYEITGCDGIMIGRGVLGNPWLFEEIASAMENRDYCPPTLSEIIDACIYHIRLIRHDKGERTASAEMKKHAALYIKGVRGAAAYRDSIMKTSSTNELEEILYKIRLENS